jgi:hypothetical protein
VEGHYDGSVMKQPPDPALYRRVADALDGVWFEDPNLTPEIDKLLAPLCRTRDAPPRGT